MGWDLEADVQWRTPADLAPLLRALAGFFGSSVTGMICRRVDANWKRHVLDDTLADIEDLIQLIAQQGQDALIGDGYLEMHLFVEVVVEGAVDPRLSVQLFGPHHFEPTGRRKSPVVVGFGNVNAYDGQVVLSNGMVMTKQTVVDALQHLAQQVSPTYIFLHTEKVVSFPLTYHLVYHHDPADYVQDVAELIRLWYSGGAGYADGRHTYDPVSSDSRRSNILFGKRRGEWLAMTKQFLAYHLPILAAHGLPPTLDRAVLEAEVMPCAPEMTYFLTDAGGFGIHRVPPLSYHCDCLYYGLIERFSQAATGVVE